MEFGSIFRKFVAAVLTGTMPLLQQHCVDPWAWAILFVSAAVAALGVQAAGESYKRSKEDR